MGYPQIILYARPNQKWSEIAINELNDEGIRFDLRVGESCNGRDLNEQGIKTIPTLIEQKSEKVTNTYHGLEGIRQFLTDFRHMDFKKYIY